MFHLHPIYIYCAELYHRSTQFLLMTTSLCSNNSSTRPSAMGCTSFMTCDRMFTFCHLLLWLLISSLRNYQNLTAVAQQVTTYASIPNLLNWETAHEPDGNSDPQDAAGDAYDTIYEMDGYHPVSIVLNCQD